jgi:hypothetical protein
MGGLSMYWLGGVACRYTRKLRSRVATLILILDPGHAKKKPAEAGFLEWLGERD